MIERFALADELTCYYDRPAEPANVHLEVRVPGRLDPAAVSACVSAVLASEPRIMARRRQGSWQRRYYWEFPVPAGADPVMASPVLVNPVLANPVLVAAYTGREDLDGQRDAFLSTTPSAPLRRCCGSCSPRQAWRHLILTPTTRRSRFFLLAPDARIAATHPVVGAGKRVWEKSAAERVPGSGEALGDPHPDRTARRDQRADRDCQDRAGSGADWNWPGMRAPDHLRMPGGHRLAQASGLQRERPAHCRADDHDQ
jgi:hypothetical protein